MQTVATRQRPWWSSPERWLPMDTVASPRGVEPASDRRAPDRRSPAGRDAHRRPTWPASARPRVRSVSIRMGGSSSRPAARSPASRPTGRIRRHSLTCRAAVCPSLPVSPDGSRLAFWQGPGGGSLRIAPLAGGDPVTVAMPDGVLAGDQVAWSPDSSGDRVSSPRARRRSGVPLHGARRRDRGNAPWRRIDPADDGDLVARLLARWRVDLVHRRSRTAPARSRPRASCT